MARAVTETNRMRVQGPVGVALRNYLTRHKLTVREFNEQVLKIGGRNVAAYNWLAGRAMPSKSFVPVLAKALGKPLAFFEAREAPKAPMKKRAAVAASEASQSNGAEVSDEAVMQAIDAFDQLMDEPPLEPVKTVVSAVVHARKPEAIMRERERATVPSVLDGSAKNSLTYWSNGDGTACVTMLYNAPRELAQKVFQALAELGVDCA